MEVSLSTQLSIKGVEESIRATEPSSVKTEKPRKFPRVREERDKSCIKKLSILAVSLSNEYVAPTRGGMGEVVCMMFNRVTD